MSLNSLLKRMKTLENTRKAEIFMAQSMLAITSDRIFTKGKDSNNSEIGKYSLGYQKQRVKEGYPNSSKVILQATRQMVNDWSVVPTRDGIGLGFKNQHNADKSGWVEDTYGKDIFKHTPQEIKTATARFNQAVKKIING